MTTKWKLRDGKWRRINAEFEEQKAKTALITPMIQKITENDYHPTKNPQGLKPEEQMEMIKLLPGLSAAEMESIIPITGPQLAESIRAIISKHRGVDRSFKDKNKPEDL